MGLCLWLGWYLWHGTVPVSDAREYAHIAHQMYLGKGMTTLVAFPSHLEYFASHDVHGPPFPNLYRFPVPIIGMWSLFHVFGVNDFSVALFSGIFFAIGLPVTYWAAGRFFSHRAAFTACFLYILNLPLLYMSISGMTENLASVLLTVIMSMAVLGCSQKRGWPYFLLLGLLFGLAVLNRTNSLVFLPILLLLIFVWQGRKARRFLCAGSIIVGALVVMTPWMVRDTVVAGRPLFSLTVERNLSNRLVEGDIDPFYNLHNRPFMEIVKSEPGRVIRKYTSNLHTGIRGYRTHIELLIPFFLIGLVVTRGVDAKRVRLMFLALGVVQYLVLCFGIPVFRFFFPFMPLLLIFCSRGLEWFFFEVRWNKLVKTAHDPVLIGRIGLAVFWIAYLAIYAGGFIRLSGDWQQHQQEHKEEAAIVDSLVPKGDVIVTNTPPYFEWYHQRPSLYIPGDFSELREIDDKYIHFNYIFLSPRNEPNIRFEEAWTEKPPADGKVAGLLKDFEPVRVFQSGAVLLRRREEAEPDAERRTHPEAGTV